jgi:hypothetical protein
MLCRRYNIQIYDLVQNQPVLTFCSIKMFHRGTYSRVHICLQDSEEPIHSAEINDMSQGDFHREKKS